MRRFWVAALLTASISVPGYAQRGGHAGGGFSGSHGFGSVSHMGGGFGGGFRSAPRWSSASRGFNTAPRWSVPSRSIGSQRAAYGNWRHWPIYNGPRGYRPGYRSSRYRQPYLPYFYANSTYLVPGLLNSYWGDEDGFYGDDESAATAQPNGQDNGAYGQETAPDYPQPEQPYPEQAPYQAQDVPPPPPGPVEPTPLAATTLVFKDGHSQQVRNYAMTRTTLYVLDDASTGRRLEIPLSNIDLPATQKTNQNAGIEFNIPAGN